ncbi:MAG: zinc ribbon domain-containing protein [Eubacteriales bacterium]|nr:zinc ribbon domain-containing protein [Eubacteriales bacterium]
MFCTKCGFNAQDSKFCPKCGTPIADRGSVQQSSEQHVQQNQDTMNYFEGQAMGQPQQEPVSVKKKKWPKVAAVVAAVLAVLCVAGYFAYPYIANMISPKNQAITALKNAGADFESMLTDSVSSLSTTSAASENELKGSLKINSAAVDGMNYMSYLKVDTINYVIQTDIHKEVVSGTVGLASGTSANVINVLFYTDADNVYFKIPELFQESFKMPVSNLSAGSSVTGSLGSLSSVLDSADPAMISQYSGIIQSVIKDIMTGFDKMIEKCEYRKTGASTYQSENGEIKVNTFDVTLTKSALLEGINAAIDALYADTEVSSYMSLITSLTGGTKDTIKAEVQKGLSSMSDIPFTIYVGREDKLVKAIVDFSAIGVASAGDISLEFIGSGNPMEHVVMQAGIDGTSVKYTLKLSDGKISAALDFVPDQTTNKGEFLSIGADMSVSGNKITVDNISCKGKGDGYTIDVSVSGQMSADTYGSMSLTAASFKDSMDLYKITSEQSNALSEELLKNIDVIKKLVSDTLFNQLILGGSF